MTSMHAHSNGLKKNSWMKKKIKSSYSIATWKVSHLNAVWIYLDGMVDVYICDIIIETCTAVVNSGSFQYILLIHYICTHYKLMLGSAILYELVIL